MGGWVRDWMEGVEFRYTHAVVNSVSGLAATRCSARATALAAWGLLLDEHDGWERLCLCIGRRIAVNSPLKIGLAARAVAATVFHVLLDHKAFRCKEGLCIDLRGSRRAADDHYRNLGRLGFRARDLSELSLRTPRWMCGCGGGERSLGLQLAHHRWWM